MIGRMRGALRAVLPVCTFAALAGPAAAQDAAEENAPAAAEGEATPDAAGQSVTPYTPDYFAAYNPANALDMLTRIPGFNVNRGGNARGFGQNAGNVLIDGERPSAKSQTLTEILQRIPAGDVIRIDVVRGGAPGVDMGGRTIVANVIRREGAGVSGTWRQDSAYQSSTGAVRAGGEATSTFRVAGADVTAALTFQGDPGGDSAREYVLDPAGQALQLNESRFANDQSTWTSTLDGARKFGDWTLRLNGRYQDGEYASHSIMERVAGLQRPAIAAGFPFIALRNDFELSASRTDFSEWEIGGDVERPLGETLTVKLIGVSNGASQSGEGRYSTYGAARGQIAALPSLSASESGESILRSVLTWAPEPDFSVETGAESAFNYLESVSTVPSAATPVSETRVEEIRLEPFITARWRARPGLTLNAALQAEGSTIRQTGFADRTRSLFYPKGSASMIWAALPRVEIRMSASHSVDQLNFFDFQRSISLSQNTQDQINPELVPQQTTSVGATAERRFWEDGVLTFSSTRFWVTDAQDRVPLGGGLEGPGNIGSGDGWVMSLSLDAPLEQLGAPNGRLQLSLQQGDYDVTDPVTGLRRSFGQSYSGMSVSLRQDYPAKNFGWGVSYSTSGDYTNYRLAEITTTEQNRGGVSIFAETARFGMTMRLTASQVGNFYADSYRQRFGGQRDIAPLAVTHWSRQTSGYTLDLRITGDF